MFCIDDFSTRLLQMHCGQTFHEELYCSVAKGSQYFDQSVEHGRGAAVLPCGMVLAGGRRKVVGT